MCRIPDLGVRERIASNGYHGEVSCLDVRHLPEVASELAQAGFNRAEIAGILGGNFRRVAAQVWK